MVRWWDVQIEKAIEISKYRIAHHEFHGNGDVAMREKAILKKQERHKQLRKAKLDK